MQGLVFNNSYMTIWNILAPPFKIKDENIHKKLTKSDKEKLKNRVSTNENFEQNFCIYIHPKMQDDTSVYFKT